MPLTLKVPSSTRAPCGSTTVIELPTSIRGAFVLMEMALGADVSLAPAGGVALTSELALAEPVAPIAMKAKSAPASVLRNITMLPPVGSLVLPLNSPLSSHFFRLLSTALTLLPLTGKGRYVPTYQYACSSCNHEFEIFQAFSDSSLTHCPECAGQLRKVYSAVGVVFKGSGFYKTDSKSDIKTDSKSGNTPVVEKTKAVPPVASSTPSASASE